MCLYLISVQPLLVIVMNRWHTANAFFIFKQAWRHRFCLNAEVHKQFVFRWHLSYTLLRRLRWLISSWWYWVIHTIMYWTQGWCKILLLRTYIHTCVHIYMYTWICTVHVGNLTYLDWRRTLPCPVSQTPTQEQTLHWTDLDDESPPMPTWICMYTYDRIPH